MMDKYFVFTDCDLDGATSYLALKWLLGTNLLPYKTTTVKNFATDFEGWVSKIDPTQYKKIFILDLDVSKCADLVDLPNVVIVDHHKSHDPVYKKATKIVKVHTSNADLMRQTLLKNVKLTPAQEKLISLTDEYDCYTIKDNKALLLNTLYWQYQGDRLKHFIVEFEQGFNGFNNSQKNIIVLQLKKIQDHLENTPIYYYKNNQYTIASMVGDFAINELADHLLKKTQCDIACIVNTRIQRLYFRRKKTSTVDLSLIVKEITGTKGEGHENACGGTLNEQFLEYTKRLSVYEKDKH